MESETKKLILLNFIVGIFVFVFCYLFIGPIMNFFIPKFLNFCSRFFSSFCNLIYQNASEMEKNNFDRAFFSFFCGAVLFLGVYVLIDSCRKENMKKSIAKPTKRLNTILFVIIYLLLFSFLATIECSNYYLNLRFDRKMKILGPVLSERQEKELIAKWATMKNSLDYFTIENSLNDLAQNNNITEPKSLWKKTK